MTKLILTAATLALLTTPALARHHDDDGYGNRGPAAVLFSKPGFQGHSFYADHEVRKLSTKDMDDKISSVRPVPPGGPGWQR